MDRPKYDGIIEKWKVETIIHRAKMMGFRAHELPDVTQEIVLKLLDFKYDPSHSGGATERTAVTTVIDHHLRKLRRSATRYGAHIERLGRSASEFSREEVDLRAMDVADVVAKLTPREQEVCRRLAEGLTKEQIAQEFGWSWHTVNRIVNRLREHFREIGLGGWVGHE